LSKLEGMKLLLFWDIALLWKIRTLKINQFSAKFVNF
jgi:hypothetical protein